MQSNRKKATRKDTRAREFEPSKSMERNVYVARKIT